MTPAFRICSAWAILSAGMVLLTVAAWPASEPAEAASPAATDPAPGDAAATHRAAGGDTYEISIFELIVPGQTYYDQQRVDAHGQLHLPIVGDVDVSGLTTTQIEQKIRDMLTTTVSLGVRHVAPEVTVTWLQQGELHLVAASAPATTAAPPLENDPMIQALRNEEAQWTQQQIKEDGQIQPGGVKLLDAKSCLRLINMELAEELAAQAEDSPITQKLDQERIDLVQERAVEESKIAPSPQKLLELNTRLKVIADQVIEERARLKRQLEDADESTARYDRVSSTLTSTYDVRAAAGIPPGVAGPLSADQRAAVQDVVNTLRQFARPGETIAAVNGIVVIGATNERQSIMNDLLNRLKDQALENQQAAETYRKAHGGQ